MCDGCSFVSKVKYTGKFVADLPNGRGVCEYPTGHVYEGMWRNGLRHGEVRKSLAARSGASDVPLDTSMAPREVCTKRAGSAASLECWRHSSGVASDASYSWSDAREKACPNWWHSNNLYECDSNASVSVLSRACYRSGISLAGCPGLRTCQHFPA